MQTRHAERSEESHHGPRRETLRHCVPQGDTARGMSRGYRPVILSEAKNLFIVRDVRPFVTSFLRVTHAGGMSRGYRPVILHGAKNLPTFRDVRPFVTAFLRVTQPGEQAENVDPSF